MCACIARTIFGCIRYNVHWQSCLSPVYTQCGDFAVCVISACRMSSQRSSSVEINTGFRKYIVQFDKNSRVRTLDENRHALDTGRSVGRAQISVLLSIWGKCVFTFEHHLTVYILN